MLAIVLLAGCANSHKASLSQQPTSAAELVGAKEVDPAMRERLSHALSQDADEKTLRDALKQRPNNVDAAIPLARALLMRESPDEALEVLDNILLAAPGDLRALNAKGVVLDHEGRHHEAQTLYRQALAIDPENPMLSNNLKLSLALEGRTQNRNPDPQLQAAGRLAPNRSR
ncbi:tetratricopeptide repeat protein [Bradyrhizobium yuanmingense]|uniref:tetratricopeptide repeat protein n=1 Tax=Bradyrhizobium yuanmingense TaxID=108015 RepID=UPI0021A95344|nr:tetratricopeptide repeat protein [Bradyrhizobium sp. CB1024]UWU83321.1 tetratricopeptide repeat protein [Bradyrhizobium sp. CB1024]